MSLDDLPRTRAQKSASTKRVAYEESIKAALSALSSDATRSNLTIGEICRHAGVSDDPMYRQHHKALREHVETSIRDWYLARGKRRRPKAPQSELEARIRLLEQEREQLRGQLKNAQLALNILGQMLETAVGCAESASVVPLRPSIPKHN